MSLKKVIGSIGLTAIILTTLLASPASALTGSTSINNVGRTAVHPLLVVTLQNAWEIASQYLSSWAQEDLEYTHEQRAEQEADDVFELHGARLEEARVIILNENPLNLEDIQAHLRFIRDHIRQGDALVVESFRHDQEVPISTLQHLFLRRLYCLLPCNAEERFSFENVKRRGQLFDRTVATLDCQKQCPRILNANLPIFFYEGATQNTIRHISNSASEQTALIRSLLKKYKRVFVLRNQGYSPTFLRRFEEEHTLTRPLPLYRALSQLTLYLSKIPHLEVFVSRKK